MDLFNRDVIAGHEADKAERRAKLSEWGRRGADKTNAGRVK